MDPLSLFFSFLERCNISTKVPPTEIKTIGDKNDCNPQAFLPWPVRETESFLVFCPWRQRHFGDVKIKRWEKTSQRWERGSVASSVVEYRSRDRKAAGSSPGRSDGRIVFSPGSTFCADSYFGICSIPVLPSKPRKISRSLCQKCRWHVTAKHTCSLRMWLRVKRHCIVVWSILNVRRDGSSSRWHQPCNNQIAL